MLALAFSFANIVSATARKKDSKKNQQFTNTYVVVTEHGVPSDGTTDATEAIQKVIDENPNRTIFFPDGLYLHKHPRRTHKKRTSRIGKLRSS